MTSLKLMPHPCPQGGFKQARDLVAFVSVYGPQGRVYTPMLVSGIWAAGMEVAA